MLDIQTQVLSLEEFCTKYYDDVHKLFHLMQQHGIMGESTWRFLQWGQLQPLRISVVGEFNHGRSSLINSLLGKPDLLPVSAKLQTRIRTFIFPLYYIKLSGYGPIREHVQLVNELRQTREIYELNNLPSLLQDEQIEPKSHAIYIYLNNPLLNQQVTLIDTPPFDLDATSPEESFMLTLSKQSDLILLVTDLNKSFSRHHEEFINELSIHIRKLTLVINKADLYTSRKDLMDTLTHIASFQEKAGRQFPRYLYSSISEFEEKNEKKKAGKGDEETGESLWDNSQLHDYINNAVENRFEFRARNWTLNILEILYTISKKDDGKVTPLLNEIKDVVNFLCEKKRIAAVFDEIEKAREADDTRVNRSLLHLEDETKKIVYESANNSMSVLNESFVQWSRRKDSRPIQLKISKSIETAIRSAIDRFNEFFKKEIPNFRLQWFNNFTQIMDMRIFDSNLQASEIEEIRQIILQYLFENQYSHKQQSWKNLLERLRSRGYESTANSPNILSGLLTWTNKLFIDVSAKEFLLWQIQEGAAIPQITVGARTKLSQNTWDIRTPPFFWMFGGRRRFQEQLHLELETYHAKKIKELETAILDVVHEFRESVKKSLQSIESEVRGTFIDRSKQKGAEEFQQRLWGVGNHLQNLIGETLLPFEKEREKIINE